MGGGLLSSRMDEQPHRNSQNFKIMNNFFDFGEKNESQNFHLFFSTMKKKLPKRCFTTDSKAKKRQQEMMLQIKKCSLTSGALKNPPIVKKCYSQQLKPSLFENTREKLCFCNCRKSRTIIIRIPITTLKDNCFSSSTVGWEFPKQQ